MSLPYATRLRIHLAESRARGVKWEQAWPAATRAEVYQADEGEAGSPWPMEYAKRVFRDGYLRLTAGSSVGALAERDYSRPSNTDTEPTQAPQRACGSGEGCDNPARAGGWLCEKHSHYVRAFLSYCLHPECQVRTGGGARTSEGHDHCPAHGGPPVKRTTAMGRTNMPARVGSTECVTPGCKRRGFGLRCKRHTERTAA